ncbi:TetR/AcrR family transcriptional regulator [candidate division KSB1 bacterium]
MTRITKSKEERRQEIIDTALQLFLSKGYEKTAVSDIVRAVDVAQGTFYYYFKSKTDVLEAVVEHYIKALAQEVRRIARKRNIDPPKRLNKIINYLSQLHDINEEIYEVLHQESNITLHYKLGMKTTVLLLPVFAEVIEEGIKSGSFDVKYPAETALLLLVTVSTLMHDMNITGDKDHKKRLRISTEDSVERILSVKNYKFKLKL